MASAELSSAHRYAAGGLFALALRQAQLQQKYSQAGFGFPPVIDPPEVGGESENDGVLPWSLEKSGLVRHVFRSPSFSLFYLNVVAETVICMRILRWFPCLFLCKTFC